MPFPGIEDFRPTPDSIPPPNALYRLKHPEGLPVHIYPLNPLDFVLRAAQIYPDKLAVAHPDVERPAYYSYAVWAQRIQNLAYALIRAGIQPGDRVAVIAPNWFYVHHGVFAARAILTPVNTRLTKPEVDYILDHSGSKLILVDHEYTHLVKGAKVLVIISNDTGRIGDPYEEFLSNGRRFSQEKGWQGLVTEKDEDAGACLCYTSGTTGRPKGVLTTLRINLSVVRAVSSVALNSKVMVVRILPMFHAAGWTYPWAITFAFASQITLRTVSYPHIWNHLLHSNVSHYCGAPTVQIGLVNAPEAKPLERPVSAIIAGSAPTAHLIGELEKRGIQPVHVYGLTYTLGPFTRNYFQPAWQHLSHEERSKMRARQGHSFATAQEARVVYASEEGNVSDGELKDVPKDGKTIGEVVTRGNIGETFYFRDPEATRKAFQGNHFHSGDLAIWHPDGSIGIVDRSKDIIISGGETDNALQNASKLAEHPDVLEVSVVGRPHPKWGERAMAFVVLRGEVIEQWAKKHDKFAEDLKQHARSRLPGFACPEWVEVVPELPKTSTGKILKTQLRKYVAKL
ncbi:acetyl-CoA synthetase-like protein [Heliocybe sulcata]|uniref:Acetyl-CoA synthetase-like protein n=1 Tax=Heliocybe sulcata TaxID=5364 RepID=A0A5C3NLE7_9AGAM|nr:acetyl-CoA synthetase-like protein [Heliocybe sulcata]